MEIKSFSLINCCSTCKMFQPPSPFLPPGISDEQQKPLITENGRSEEGSLEMASLATAARMGDIKTTKYLVNLGIACGFVADLDRKEKKEMIDTILTKIDNIEQLIATGIAFFPSVSCVEPNPFTRGLFSVNIIPATDINMELMINKNTVRTWDPATNGEGCYPLHYMCSLPDAPPEAVRYIIENSTFDINQGTNSGYTALIIAVIRGNYPAVKILIENGASQDHAPIINVQIEELGLYYPYIKVFSPAKVTFPQIYYHFTPMEAAIYANNEDILRYLVRKGANIHKNQGLWSSLYHPIVRGRRRIVERLLEIGVEINGEDLLGTSPLHKAAGEGLIDLTHVLMRNGAKVNAKDIYGWTALHVACLFSRNVSLEMIQLLLDGGADINATTRFGFTPLNLAEAGSDLFFLEYLSGNIEKLSNDSTYLCLPEEDTRKEHEDIITLLLDNGANPNHQDDFLGWTALHWAAAAGDLRTARLLVSRGARVSIKSKFNFDAYQNALYFKRRAVSSFLMTLTDEPPANQ